MIKYLFLLALLLLPFQAQAQTAAPSLPSPTPIDVGSVISSLAFDSGVGWDIENKQWTSVNTIKFLEYNNTANTNKYSAFLNYIGQVDPSVSVGYSTTDKAVVGLSFTLVNPKMLGFNSVLLNYLTVKPFAMYSFYHLTSTVNNIKNSWILGAYFVQIKF